MRLAPITTARGWSVGTGSPGGVAVVPTAVPVVPDTLGFMYSITGHDGRSVNSNGGVDVLGAGVVALEGARPGEVAPAPDGRTTRWDGHRSQRLLEMVRQIRRVVHEHGPDISMEEIATRLGTSKSILYRYFRDKTALQVALGEYILGRARSRLAEASASSRDPRRAVEAMVATYLEIVDQSRNVFLFVNRPAQAAAEGNLRVFVGQVEDLVAATLARLFPEGVIPAARLRIWAAATVGLVPVSYTHLRAHETRHDLV